MSEAQKQWAATAGTGIIETSWFADISTLFLVVVCPITVFIFHYIYTVLGGDERALAMEIWAGGDVRTGLARIKGPTQGGPEVDVFAGHGRPAPLISHDRIADGRTGGGDKASKAIVEEKTVRFFVVGHVDIQAASTRPGVREGKVAQRSLLHLL